MVFAKLYCEQLNSCVLLQYGGHNWNVFIYSQLKFDYSQCEFVYSEFEFDSSTFLICKGIELWVFLQLNSIIIVLQLQQNNTSNKIISLYIIEKTSKKTRFFE